MDITYSVGELVKDMSYEDVECFNAMVSIYQGNELSNTPLFTSYSEMLEIADQSGAIMFIQPYIKT